MPKSTKTSKLDANSSLSNPPAEYKLSEQQKEAAKAYFESRNEPLPDFLKQG